MELLASGQDKRPRLRATGEQRRHLTLELGPGHRMDRHSSHCNLVHLSRVIMIYVDQKMANYLVKLFLLESETLEKSQN